MKVEFLEKERPVFTRALVEPWRLVCLGFGLILLCVGSHMTPSVDWDYPISFIMGIWAYVFAPWTFRALFYRRWKMIPLALLAAWAGIDGVYSLYWWCRGFDALSVFRVPALSVFRVPNAIYSAPLYFLLGFAMNLDFRQSSERKEPCHG